MLIAVMDWQMTGVLVGSVATLTTVPLVFVAMYLRGFRDQQVQRALLYVTASLLLGGAAVTLGFGLARMQG